jgi:hypothetical protein
MIYYRMTIVWLILIVININSFLYALPVLTIEDEIIMSRLVRHSNSIDELRLCLKLFPESPYEADFKKRLFKLEMNQKSYAERQKYAELEKHNLDFTLDRTLTAKDDLVMSHLLEHSYDHKALRLFIKLFPRSAFRPVFENRLNGIELSGKNLAAGVSVEEAIEKEADVESFQDIEEEIKADSEDKVDQTEQPEPEKDQKESPEKKEEAAVEPEPEKDWAKVEIGIPTAVKITDDSGNAQATDGSPLALYLGWSSEYMFDTGGGGATYYISQKLAGTGAELQHLFMEAQIKGLVLNQINWSIGWGTGITTTDWSDKPSGMEIVPGTGTIQSLSMGYKYGSFGINYAMVSFTGSYQWAISSGVSTSKGETKWQGSMNMFTFEYHY